MQRKFVRYLLLLLLSAGAVLLLYPLLHELGHAVVTLLLGGRIGGFSMFPLPHIESGLPFDDPGRVALVSLAGLLFPLLLCIPLLRTRGYLGYTVILILLITAISNAVELCIAIQYAMGDVMKGDDIVLFLQNSGLQPAWAYLYTGLLCFWSLLAILLMDPIFIIEDLAAGKAHHR